MKSKLVFALILTSSALAACRGQTSKDSPIVGIRNMYDQQRYDIQSESTFFDDKRTMRPAVEGTVSREMETDPRVLQGRLEDNSGYVLTIPQESVASFGGMDPMLKRGKERYGIYCTPCHDNTGNGKGAVTQRAQAGGAAAFVPTSFHQDRIRHMPDGQLYATIENGKSNMPPYGQMISVHDRWAIVAYVRALELANPRLGDEKPDDPTAPPPAPVPAIVAPSASSSAAPAPSGSAPSATSAAPAASAPKPAASAH